MLIAMMLGLFIQSPPLSAAAGKERNLPDMPRLAPCNIKADVMASSMRALPAPVRSELLSFFAPDRGIADAGESYNSTDVITGSVPGRRFLRAYRAGPTWIVWYESGGLMTMHHVIAIRSEASSRGQVAYRVQPGTSLGGNLCAASKAILAGVLTSRP